MIAALHRLGWSTVFEFQFEELALTGCVPGRVARVDRGAATVLTADGEHPNAKLAGRQHRDSELQLAVGDWVALDPSEDTSLVRAILPRRTRIARNSPGGPTAEQVLAANVDTAVLVCALDRDFNLRRIERYLALLWEGGATPVIALNKADLCEDPGERVLEVEAVAPAVAVHLVSVATGDGMEALMDLLVPRSTFVLLGSSGAGKSSMTNFMLGADTVEVGDLRGSVEKGKHTTTHRELFILPSGALCIDTPGLREIAVWGSDAGLGNTFPEIEALLGTCRFADCRHRSEPGCAVRDAIASGAIEPDRLASYEKLKREFAHLDSKQNERQRRADDKRLSKMYKRVQASARGRKGDG